MRRGLGWGLLAGLAWMSAQGLAAGEVAEANPMIHADGTRLVDGSGRPIQLRGVILEGWLMWNGTLFGAGLTSETKIAERIEALVGPEALERFRTAIYDNFITERDIEMIAGLGFNVVRAPFNHTVLEKDGEIDAAAPGWAYLDRLLDWCEAHEVYAVLDLHAVPGGQSGVMVSDPDKEHVWASEEKLQRTVDLWVALATRYRDRTIVAGYDLVNEPEPPTGAELVDLYRRIIKAIRPIDPHHLVFLEGGGPASSDFSFYTEPLDSNQAYSFHTYNLFTNGVDRDFMARLAQLAVEHNVPLWNGEIGAHTEDWVGQNLRLFADPAHHVNGWIFWPWKRVTEGGWARARFKHLMEISSTPDWDTVRKYIGSIFGRKKIPQDTALRALDDFVNAVKVENLTADDEMLAVLQAELDGNVGTLPTEDADASSAQGPMP